MTLVFSSCQDAPSYDETKFNERKKSNRLIKPIGFYVYEEGDWDSFRGPKFLIDTNNQVIFSYRDAADSLRELNGNWENRSLDSQKFSLPAPLNYGILTDNGIYFLDSNRMIFFKKQ